MMGEKSEKLVVETLPSTSRTYPISLSKHVECVALMTRIDEGVISE